ncbi:hypothetical protein FDECE_12244 [Fusarium decemcellulare]|nr:hypothetical protein FDECE_12244 [Fusarium decemcellulare]
MNLINQGVKLEESPGKSQPATPIPQLGDTLRNDIPENHKLQNLGDDTRVIVGSENRENFSFLMQRNPWFEKFRLLSLSDSRSNWRQLAARIESFCEGAQHLQSGSGFHRSQNSQSDGLRGREPKGWVSDRKRVPGILDTPRKYPELMSGRKLSHILRETDYNSPGHEALFDPSGASKSFPEDPNSLRVPPSRRVNYIDQSPKPHLKLDQSHCSAMPFTFAINLPFYALTTDNTPDTRTLLQRPLRHRCDLDFLSVSHSGPTRHLHDGPQVPAHPFLVETVFSLVITGKNDKYWSAFCFNEETFEERLRPRLVQSEDMEWIADPITLEPEKSLPTSPLTYGLQALAAILRRMNKDQHRIHQSFQRNITQYVCRNWPTEAKVLPGFFSAPESRHLFRGLQNDVPPPESLTWKKSCRTLKRVIYRNSTTMKKLDEFVAKDIAVGRDGIPTGHMFRSLQSDNRAIGPVLRIRQSQTELHEINENLLRLTALYEELSVSLDNIHVSFVRPWVSVLADSCKRSMETVAGCKLSWWPLEDPEYVLKSGYTRVYSTPSPHRRIYDDIPTSFAEVLFPKLAEARASSTRCVGMGSTYEAVFLQKMTLMRLLLVGFGSSLTTQTTDPGAPTSQDNTGDGATLTPRGSIQRPSESDTTPQPTSRDCYTQQNRPLQARDAVAGHVMNGRNPVLFLSADTARNESIAQTITPGDNDRTTCQNLRSAYEGLSNRWWCRKRATGIKFYRVYSTPSSKASWGIADLGQFDSFLFKGSLDRHFIDIHKDRERYPDASDPEYRYSPRPWPFEVPYPSRELWHYFMHPEDCGTSTEMNQMLPIRVSDAIPHRIRAFGIHIEERYSVLTIFLPAFLMILLTFLATLWFIPAWLKNHPHDLQNATVPITLTFTVIGCFIQLLVSLLLFRWTST